MISMTNINVKIQFQPSHSNQNIYVPRIILENPLTGIIGTISMKGSPDASLEQLIDKLVRLREMWPDLVKLAGALGPLTGREE